MTPQGVITGFGFGEARTHDQQLATTFFALRHEPSSRLPSIGSYVAAKGFAGEQPQQWGHQSAADVVTAPHKRSRHRRWPKALRRWLAGLRQIIEIVNDQLLNTFHLARERPHDLTGFQARLAAKVALHTFCLWLNQQLDRPLLAFATLLIGRAFSFTPNV